MAGLALFQDPELSARYARLGEAFVLDAFGSAHRAHASVVGVARLLPAYAGFLMEKEVRALSRLLKDPERPYAVVLGGAKVSDKIGVIESLLPRIDRLLIGGAMAFTFLKALGGEVGKSLVEEDRLDLAKDLLGRAEALGVRVYLPEDVVAPGPPPSPTWAWTSAPRPGRPLPGPWKGRGRSSGTGPWGSLRCLPLTRGPWPWGGPSPPSRAPSPWWAGATRWRR